MNERIKELAAKANFGHMENNTSSGITPDLSIAIAVGLKKHFGVKE